MEHWVRQSGGHWDISVAKDRETTIRIESLDCEIPVAEIYSGVDLISLV